MILDETADMFGSMQLTHIVVLAVTLAYLFSYGWLLVHLIQTWRQRNEVS